MEARGETDSGASGLAKRFPYLRDELRSVIRDNVQGDAVEISRLLGEGSCLGETINNGEYDHQKAEGQ